MGAVEAFEANTRRPNTISSGRRGKPTQSFGVSVHSNHHDASSEHNVIKLCTSINKAHMCGAFGGKPSL